MDEKEAHVVTPPQADRPVVSSKLKIGAAMTTPRVGFMDTQMAAHYAILPYTVGFYNAHGAYWEQCFEGVLAKWCEDGVDAILTIDYDSLFTQQTVGRLVKAFVDHPEVDALAAVQVGRQAGRILADVDDPAAHRSGVVDSRFFEPEISKIKTAHFGLTMLRVEALKDMPHPWFWSQPAPDGTWGKGKVDADIGFWHKWREHGKSLYLANRIPIGHSVLSGLWPGQNGAVVTQMITDWRENGQPEGIWE